MVKIEKSKSTKHPLIIDSDASFLASLKNHPSAATNPPIVAANGKSGQLLLVDTGRSYSSIFVNLNLKDGYGLSVVRFAHRYRPSIPKFSLHDSGNSEYTAQELHRLGIQGVVNKPATYDDILEAQKGDVKQEFNQEIALSLGKSSTDEVGRDRSFEKDEFIPILAENFISGSRSFFDLYVRLSSSRCVKILRAGENFSLDRLSNYLRKGVIYFYLRREAHEQYLSYCDQLSGNLNRSNKVSAHKKLAHTLNHGKEVLQFFKTQGIHESQMNHASSFVANVSTLLTAMKKETPENSFLNGFMADINQYEHGAGTALIACMLGDFTGIRSGSRVDILGVASLLHDIGLQQLPKSLHDEDMENMTEEQKAAFRTHPIVGADILRTLPKVEPVTVQAVVQHHERRSQTGFPYKLGAGSINRIAEIIGVSDEFMHQIAKLKIDPQFNPIAEMENRILKTFSLGVADAFRAVFIAKKESKAA